MPRIATIVAVSNGSVYKITAGGPVLLNDGQDALVTHPFKVQSVVAFRNVYYLDGTNARYAVGDTDTVLDWEEQVTTNGEGDFPKDSGGNIGRLLGLYRGRMIHAGFPDQPQNWVMSRVDDPLDYEFGAQFNDSLSAVEGQNGRVGLVPAAITAIIPWSDDTLFFGSDSSIHMMRGDPKRGGAIDRISDQTGVAWGRAWAKDPGDVIYFLGTEGVYRLAPNGQMVNLTENKLDGFFAQIDYRFTNCRMEWDRRAKGLHVFLTRFETFEIEQSGSASGSSSEDADFGFRAVVSTHLFWDQRTNAWWPDRYPDQVGPVSTATYDADEPDDRKVLLGGWDGYIREIDYEAKSDDGEPIASSVIYPPLQFGLLDRDTMLSRLYAVTAMHHDCATFKLLAGNDVQEAIVSPVRASREWCGAGRKPTLGVRVRESAVLLKVEHDTLDETWSIEDVNAEVQVRGRQQ